MHISFSVVPLNLSKIAHFYGSVMTSFLLSFKSNLDIDEDSFLTKYFDAFLRLVPSSHISIINQVYIHSLKCNSPTIVA